MNIPHQQEFSMEYARENLNKVIESAQKEAVTLVQNDEKFFLINENILESWLETFEILKDCDLKDQLFQDETVDSLYEKIKNYEEETKLNSII